VTRTILSLKRNRISDAIARRLGRGFAGKVAREGVLLHPVVFGDLGRVHVDESAVVNDTLFNSVSGAITVEPHAFFGHGVSLLTGTHDVAVLGADRQRAIPREGRDIVIGEGAWIASNATVIGPCRVGAHAVVAAGALVVEDVPERAIVAGVPARVVSQVDPKPSGGWADRGLGFLARATTLSPNGSRIRSSTGRQNRTMRS
jgi:acetyltransferase-like isoleucine patch superfamily enzyme